MAQKPTDFSQTAEIQRFNSKEYAEMSDQSVGVYFTWLVAANEAMYSRHACIEPMHLFLGLCSLHKILEGDELQEMQEIEQARPMLEAERDLLIGIFQSLGLDQTILRRELRACLSGDSIDHQEGAVIHRSVQSRHVFTRAMEHARIRSSSVFGVMDLLIALLDEETVASRLREKGVDISALKEQAAKALGLKISDENNGAVRDKECGARSEFLSRYTRDLTQLATEGKLRPTIGRREQMLQLVRTLARESKNNPVLTGDAGVGKTAIVEGLAWRISQGMAPSAVQERYILQLDMTALVAGTKYRGDFEERLEGLLNEARVDPNLILFIDEIHTLVGAGAGGDAAMDAANLLKPALSRGELCVIGATTGEEYRRYIEKDPALERRFQPIHVAEPDTAESLEILRGIRKGLQEHHDVVIEDEALVAAVDLSQRYIPDRRLPDKARDLLDEACATLAVQWTSRIAGMTIEDGGSSVSADTVARVLARWTGITVEQLTERERERLERMSEQLRRRVIGQDAACEAVAQAVQRARLGLKTPERPIGVLLFVGQTGIGKTELAKATAEFLFGSEQTMLRLDMSEYQESHTLSRLIGAPPGYVGYDEAGQLTGPLRRNPHCLVLLDEFEKAHPEVQNLFLQVFEDGRLTDSSGRTADASHALFILTSNACAERKQAIGFHLGDGEDEPRSALVESGLRPELINRIDQVIPFRKLEHEDRMRIAELFLERFRTRLQAQDVDLHWDSEVLGDLAERSADDQFGARPLRRLIEQEVEKGIAEMLVHGQVGPENQVILQIGDGELEMNVRGGQEATS
jgi:ATP-dependent Clp protease ATP-binding subunit ClpC